MIEHIHGEGHIAAWDQSHADALNALRKTSGFVLTTLNADGTVRFQACTNGLSTDAFETILTMAGEHALMSASELPGSGF